MSTIGYQGTTIDRVVASLKQAGVTTLLDIRAVPLSRKPGFSKRQLAAGLDAAGIAYVGLRGLGTPPAGRVAARRGNASALRAIYSEHLAGDQAQAELGHAKVLAARGPCCLLCFERDPTACHRLLVAEAMDMAAHHLYADLP